MLRVMVRLCFLCLTAIAFAVYCFPLVHCDRSITFGKIEIIDDVTDDYQVTGIQVYNKAIIYRSLLNKDLPTGNFTKKTILAKFNATETKYDWMIDIDTGDEHFVPIFLPCCDQRSVIVVFSNCTNDVVPFHQRAKGDGSPYTLMIKLDEFGAVVWNKTVRATAPNIGGVVTTDAYNVCNQGEDTIYLIGLTNHTITFDCLTKAPVDDPMSVISQYSHEGNCLWAAAVSNATLTHLEFGSEIYVTGRLYGDSNFGYSFVQGCSSPCIFVAVLIPDGGAVLRSLALQYPTPRPIGISMSNESILSVYFTTSCQQDLLCFMRHDLFSHNLTQVSVGVMILGERFINSMDIYGIDQSVYLTGTESLEHETRAFVAKVNTSSMGFWTFDTLELSNGLSSTGLKISVGSDGYVSALGRSELPYAISLSRILHSNSTFNYIAEILDHPQVTCFGYSSYDKGVCGGRGECERENICNCDYGFSGLNCDDSVCNGVPSIDPTVCNGRGSCVLNDTCLCEKGFMGQNCEASNAIVWLSSNALEGLFGSTLTLSTTIEYGGVFPVDIYARWILLDDVAGTQRIYNESYTLHSPVQLIQLNITDLIRIRQYNATATIQIENTTNIISSTALSFWVGRNLEMKSLTVIPTSGAILYDHFLLVTNISANFFYRFGYVDGNNNQVFLSDWVMRLSSFNTTLPILGNVTLFAQVSVRNRTVYEGTAIVTVYPGEPSKVTNVLTEQANDLSHTNGTQFETQLTTYTTSLINSIQVIPANQTSRLLSNLINIVNAKQEELSTAGQIEAVKAISRQYQYLSEASTVQTSLILINSIQRNDSKISDSISVAHNLANVMISTNSSMAQRESFSSMVVVLTDKVRQNMTDGQTEEISLPNLETVISRLNSTSMNANSTVLVRHPSSSGTNTNTKFVQIVLNRDVLADSGVAFVQGQVIANPPNQYSDKCNTSGVSPTVSTMLFTKNQQQVQSVDSSTPLSEASLVLPSISSLRNRSDDYQYACKYLNSENKKWLSNSNICRTVTMSKSNTTSENVVVQCVCSQSVSHTVSLDYIQSSESVESGSTCSNPCGCSSIERGNQPRRMKAYAIALIVLACLTLAIIIAVIVVVSIVVVKLLGKGQSKYELKKPRRAPTDEIEQRFDSMYD